MIVKPKKVLILGSSALKIGEAGEFDYSGSQAIKALKEEGIRTVLINPNIATIQTSETLADEVYFLPITPEFVEKIIEKEKPDGIFLSFGGQTALNCGLKLEERGVLAAHNVRVLGTPIATIRDTEDRELFRNRLDEIGCDSPESKTATTVEKALACAEELGYPVMCRIAFALGGLGSGVCANEDELRDLAGRALSYTNQILIEECLTGWKEIEYEVVRDRFDNCITVCNMENLDPLGVHTGESIVVAPSQTLTNSEYHMLREIAIKVIRHLGIVGECNIQYALDPASEEYRIIEVNARLSRSSALASKATGYPLAFIAAKLSLGYGLHQLPNSMTKVTSAFFEPALDYCVVKIPRWDLKKFRRVKAKLGSAMKSVGEVMAIGRTFEEAIQKALRMLDNGARGLVANDGFEFGDIEQAIRVPTENRIFAIVRAFRSGFTVEQIHELSRIDPWFLSKIKRVVDHAVVLKNAAKPLDASILQQAKQLGFVDKQIALLTDQDEPVIYAQREELGLHPFVKQIDTLAGEFPAQTNYLYLTYNAIEDDVEFPFENSVLLLGSGVYRIGCSVEFDWCCVNAGKTLRELGYQTVMLNYNPETVSTDYDEFDQLFFDEISFETVREIARKIEPIGVFISAGGQIANNLAMKLHNAGLNILGTAPASIDNAENRHAFSSLLDELGVDQPPWKELSTISGAQLFANDVEYPVLIRPSYVLSGAAMAVASNDVQLAAYLKAAAKVSPEYPIVISKYLENAKEIEFDAVAKNGQIIVYAISEHVENAGVHSGDATLVFPPQRTYLETIRRIRKISKQIAERLNITGPFNIQYIAKDNAVMVIECNLRASRSFPFVSKILKQNFIDIATRVTMGEDAPVIDKSVFELNYVGVKAPQFSFTRLEGADPTLGVEMASTGEVGCIGNDFDEAFLKALLSVGFTFPVKAVMLSVGSIKDKAEMLVPIRLLESLGVALFATEGTAVFLKEHAVPVTAVNWPLDGDAPTAVDRIKNREIDLVINIPKSDKQDELTNGYMIRRAAADYDVPLITNRQIAARLCEALSRTKISDLEIKPWSAYETTTL